MILSRLYLRNFRQYEQQVIEFSHGITGIVGPNGAGKSTLLEAISWCLYGNRAARSGKEGIKRQMAAETEDCQVRLDFVLDGQEYGLTRTIKGKSGRSEATLIRSGKIDVVSTREVDSFIIKLLGLDLRGFSSSFFARQKELNALSDARPAQRKDHLAQMLGVGRLDTALSHLREDVREIRQRLEILSQNIIEEDQVKSLLKSKDGYLVKLKQDKSDILERLRIIGVKRESSDKLIAKLTRDQVEHQKLDIEAARLQSRLGQILTEAQKRELELQEISSLFEEKSHLESRIARFEVVEQELNEVRRNEIQKQERDNLLGEIERIETSHEQRTANQLSYQTEFSGLAQKLTGKDNLLANLKDKRQAYEKSRGAYRQLVSDLKVLESDGNKLENQKSEISQLGPEATCKFCLRPLGDLLGDIELHFEQELTTIKETIERLEKQISDVETGGKIEKEAVARLEKAFNDLAEDERSLSVLQVRLTEGEVIIKEGRIRLESLQARLLEIGAVDFDADRLKRAKREFTSLIKDKEHLIRVIEKVARQSQLEAEQGELNREKEQLSDDIKKAQAGIAKIGFKPEPLVSSRLEGELLRDQESNMRITAERTDGQMRLVESERETLKKQLREFIASKKEITGLRNRLTVLEKLSVLFADFRVFLIGRIRPTLSRGTSALFREMTDGLYPEIELDEEYNLKIFDGGTAHPINRFSGGEIDLANLCFRLAISVEMAAMAKIAHNFIILDEVFGSQDLVRRQMIIKGLTRLTNRFPQIIIVSHIDGIKDMVENRIIIERDQFGNSRASVQSR